MAYRRTVMGSAAGLASAVLVLGSGVLAPLWLLGTRIPGLPGWDDFTATTVGDTFLLPILAAGLFAAFRYLPVTRISMEKWILISGALIGVVGGAVLQASWLIDNKPRLTWVLPQPHRFSVAGWYHAIFLCAVSGLLISLALGSALRLHFASEIYKDRLARSPLLVVILTCTWVFSLLVVHDGGAGISGVTTILSVAIPAIAAICLCLYAFRSWKRTSEAFMWALLLSALLYTLIARWPKIPLAFLGFTVGLCMATGIHFRDTKWRGRTVEYLLICSAVLCFLVLPLADPTLVLENLALALAAIPVILFLTWVGPLVPRDMVRRCSLYNAVIITIFALSVPTAGWLIRVGGVSSSAGAFIVLIAAVVFGQLLVPGYKTDMRILMEMEAQEPGVTASPELSAEGSRVAIRGAAWGLGAIAGMLGVEISAGPSMGFSDGKGFPALDLGITVSTVTVGVLATAAAFLARRRAWAPVLIVIGSCSVSALALVGFSANWRSHAPWWIWASIAAFVVALWQIESIIANAAMRPRWLVRRPWRHAVAISTAMAVGLIVLFTCTDGLANRSGKPATSLASLVVFAGGALLGAILVAGVGLAIDWQPSAIAGGRAITSGPSADAPNWARYRMRSSLFQDYFLIQGLAVIAIWLPSLSIEHIGISTQTNVFYSAVVACTGMLFFGPILVWSMQNSVKHIEEQSRKAGRMSKTFFFGAMPYVSLDEEKLTLFGMLKSADGPARQRDWARALSVHQLHLNILAICVAVISIVGSFGVLSGITIDAAGKAGVTTDKRPSG